MNKASLQKLSKIMRATRKESQKFNHFKVKMLGLSWRKMRKLVQLKISADDIMLFWSTGSGRAVTLMIK
jgi:hypothetical protein